MIYVLYALLAALGWAIWFILQLDLWIPLVITGVMGLVALGTFIYLMMKARRAAAALERALADQGKQQVMNARPEKRAEIQALQKQITDGISALKTSKLGGKKRGVGALYSLPWYAIIGPPGAGKTTALRHSGLVFPYADSAVRGVGGTRNCDWWFTNEAIILDTAGRYTTESEDQQEWLAFLDMLRKYRSQKPLNGLIVAVAMPDIVDASEQQLEVMGKKLRARIDEVMTRLRMVLPVYFLVTKCDLIAGFTEFFGDLRKSERAQAWGATVNLKEDKQEPGAIFAREFDVLVREVHARAVRRLAQERDWRLREAIYQFPLEFAGIKRNLQEVIAQVFMVNAFQGTPTFRGIYFSSGTQEGTPLNRVLQRMGQAMGIQQYRSAAQQPRVESKSYFLHDVFMRVVFPDAPVAGRSASEIRRQRLLRVGVSVTALAVALTFAIPSIVSFVNNRGFLSEAKAEAKAAASIDWEDGKPIAAKLDELDPVLARLQQVEKYREDGEPWSMGFLMYMGDRLHAPLIHVYIANMQQAFVKPCKYYLERKLAEARGERYYEEREVLKTYLMLSDVDNLDVEWATGRYTALWAELQKSTSDVAIVDLKKRMLPHVRFYFELIKPQGGDKKPRAKPVAANDKIVAQIRDTLQSVPVRKRYYSLFIDSITYELYDPSRDADRANLKFPPESLDTMFTDRPEVKKWITSKTYAQSKKWYEVEGPYTEAGHVAVLANITEATELLEREQWVVPLTEEERGDRVAANVKRMADDYEQRYIQAWKDFLLDLDVRPPANLNDAKELYAVLQKPEWPYLRILRRLEDHTQWRRNLGALENDKVNTVANRKLNRFASRQARGLRFNLDVKKIAGKTSRVPEAFKKTVGFGVPQDGSKGVLNETSLAQYMELLGRVREEMVQAMDQNPDANVNVVARRLQNAVKETEALLQTRDDMAKRTLLPLLQNPLNVGGKIPLSNPYLLGG
ncbi:MAG: type VI secretion system membrane subunit TssM [Polyangiaceae bacterium]